MKNMRCYTCEYYDEHGWQDVLSRAGNPKNCRLGKASPKKRCGLADSFGGNKYDFND
jgi:hypothetical protein